MTTCHFCGAGPPAIMTKEHPFGRWSREFLRAFKGADNTLTTYDRSGGVISTARGRFSGRQHVHDSFIKNVCEDCNGGWLSIIQNGAAPIVKSLIRHPARSLPMNERKMLANWAATVVMTWESADPSTLVTTMDDKAFLRKRGKLPNRWRVLICPHAGSWSERVARRAFTIVPKGADLLTYPRSCDGHVTVFGIGLTVFFVLATNAGKPSMSHIEKALMDIGWNSLWPVASARPWQFVPISDEEIFEIYEYLAGPDQYLPFPT